MITELDAKAKVALDLLQQGAEEVSIVGTDITVRRKLGMVRSEHDDSRTQIYIQTQANAGSSSNISAYFSVLRQELMQVPDKNDKSAELDERIKQIEEELKKQTPDESKLKGLLHWFMDFDWGAFIKIVRVVLEKMSP